MVSRINNPVDSRGMRGILSRGRARYGISNSPKPGQISSIQKAAAARIKRLQRLNDARRGR